MARPPRLAYRAGKLMRRRPGLIAAAAAGVLVTAGFAATLVVHADRVDTERAVAEAERDRARIAAASAEQVRDFLVEAFEFADPAQTQGLGATARDILDAGAERALVAQSADPLVQADMLTAIAEVYLRLNVNSGARPLAQASLALREEHAEPLSPGVLENRWQLLRGTTDWGERARHYPELVELGRELYGSEHPRFAALLGDHARAMPDRAASEATFDTAISILRRHPGDVRTQLATTLLQSTYNRGAPPYALDRALEALELRRAVHGNEHPTVARSLSDLALFHERTDPVAADTLMREAVAIHRRTAGESHTTTLTLMNNWAGILRDQGRFAEAEPAYREVLRLRRAHQPDEPAPAALSEAGLGIVLLETDRAAEAKPLLRSAVATYPISGGRGRASRGHLARALVELGEFEEAEALLHELLESSRERASDADERETLERLASLYRSWGQGELSPLDRDRLVALRVAATER